MFWAHLLRGDAGGTEAVQEAGPGQSHLQPDEAEEEDMATEDEVMAIEEEDMAIEEDHMAIEDENTDNMRAEEKVEKCQYGQETMPEPERADCLVSQVLLSCLVWTVTQRQWSVSNLQTSALLAQAGTQILH